MPVHVELISCTESPEKLIERVGRVCYKTDEYITETSHVPFLTKRIEEGHLALLEHAHATFRIIGSRAMTHQHVRHRHLSYAQQSQRYVEASNPTYITPPSIENNPEAKTIFDGLMKQIWDVYAGLREMKILKEDARFVLPNACESELYVSGNFRSWRDFLILRRDVHAQWEIRGIADRIHQLLSEKAPTIFPADEG